MKDNKLSMPPMPPKPDLIDWHRITGIINILLFVGLGISLTMTLQKVYDYGDNCEKMMWYGASARLYGAVKDKEIITETKLKGLYSPNSGIFCVNGDNFTQEQNTVCHEYCHYLIDESDCRDMDGSKITCQQHFCGDDS